MKVKQDEAVVDILGGFGNQLFQLSFANYLRSKGYKVFINLNNFRRVSKERNSIITNRELILPLSYFKFDELSSKKFIKYDLIDKLKFNNLNKFMTNKLTRYYFSWFNDKNLDLEKSSKFNRFTGYWQSLKILENNKDFLISGLSKNKDIFEGLESLPKKGSTALHVRRTDYLEMGEDLNENYYREALNYAKNNIINFNYEIFTDDEDWVKERKIFKDATKINSFQDNKENTILSFSSMLKNENFIISNSTFSLLASFLKETNKSTVLYPEPWFKKLERNNLAKSSWIPIKNN
mgnify:CR=1 FL=1